MNHDKSVIREKELTKVEELINSTDLSKEPNLVFYGAPCSGKTSLLERAEVLIEEARKASRDTTEVPDEGTQEKPHQAPVSQFIPLAVSIDFGAESEQSNFRSELEPTNWEGLQTRIRNATPTGYSSKVEEIASQYIESIESKEFFEALGEQGFRVFFLIDNIDQGWSAERENNILAQDTLTAENILQYAQDTPSVVKVITTSSEWQNQFDNSRLFDKQWLTLLSAEEAKKWVSHCLRSRGSTPELMQTVLEWAGYHPYYIKALCDQLNSPEPPEPSKKHNQLRSSISRLFYRPPSQEESAIQRWRDGLQPHLNQLWIYLKLYTLERESTLKALSLILDDSTKASSRYEMDIKYLHQRTIVSVDAGRWSEVQVPSRLVREFLREKIYVPSFTTAITSEEWVYRIVFFLLFAVTGIVTFESTFNINLTPVYVALLIVFVIYAILLLWMRVLSGNG